MDAMVNELVEKKSLTKQDISHLVELHGCTRSVPVSVLDIRVAKRRELQELTGNSVKEIDNL